MDKNTNVVKDTLDCALQVFTGDWVDLGDLIEMWGYSRAGIWIKFFINDSVDLKIRALGKLTKDDEDSYTFPIEQVLPSRVNVQEHEFVFSDDENSNFLLQITTEGFIPYLQLQIKADVSSGSPGYVDYCYVTKIWR